VNMSKLYGKLIYGDVKVIKLKVVMRSCFVIAPLGDEGSETRQRSDKILEHLIKPAAKECHYDVVRSDVISEPGYINLQITEHLINADLVIADLTENKPNVYYELGIRHAVNKPVVTIIEDGETIPFDLAPMRTIHVDHKDLNSVAGCKEDIIKYIRSVERNPPKYCSPTQIAIDLQSLYRFENLLNKSNVEIISQLQELKSAISDLSEK